MICLSAADHLVGFAAAIVNAVRASIPTLPHISVSLSYLTKSEKMFSLAAADFFTLSDPPTKKNVSQLFSHPKTCTHFKSAALKPKSHDTSHSANPSPPRSFPGNQLLD